MCRSETKIKLVVIESPYAGDIELNTIYARKCLRWSLEHGEAPFAGHLLYTQVWNDADPELRAAGIAAHCAWIRVADCVVVYSDHGISAGMQMAIEYANEVGTPVMKRAIGKAKLPWWSVAMRSIPQDVDVPF